MQTIILLLLICNITILVIIAILYDLSRCIHFDLNATKIDKSDFFT